jgi:hypothetical protein
MNAGPNLDGILDQWLDLTRAEAAAIQASNWGSLEQIQARKSSLQQPLADVFARFTASGAELTETLREKAGRIISLLTRNGEVLAAQLRRARARQESFDQVSRTLNRIQQSYARPAQRTRVNFYS